MRDDIRLAKITTKPRETAEINQLINQNPLPRFFNGQSHISLAFSRVQFHRSKTLRIFSN